MDSIVHILYKGRIEYINLFAIPYGLTAAFTIQAEKRLNEEVQRVERYLDESTAPRLKLACETVLIQNHLPAFYEEFQHLLNRNQDDGGLFWFHHI